VATTTLLPVMLGGALYLHAGYRYLFIAILVMLHFQRGVVGAQLP
jgi:hypothetical protein